MASQAFDTFTHAIQDPIDLLNHFDTLNKLPSPPEIEVLKRASLVMALAALETYFEDRIVEAVDAACVESQQEDRLKTFYKETLVVDLKTFHSPNTDRVRLIFSKYLKFDITESWSWNNCNQEQARAELNRLVKKRGDIAHRSLRPISGLPAPARHAVTRDEMRKHIHFIKELVRVSDEYLDSKF